jgi:hypothetical protein
MAWRKRWPRNRWGGGDGQAGTRDAAGSRAAQRDIDLLSSRTDRSSSPIERSQYNLMERALRDMVTREGRRSVRRPAVRGPAAACVLRGKTRLEVLSPRGAQANVGSYRSVRADT